MQKYLFLLFVLPLLSFQGFHKFYVSVTEIEYKSEAASLQIISRVFIDDMENLLKTRYDEELYLTAKEEHPSAEVFLEKYISEKFKIEVDGKPVVLHYLGKKYDNDIMNLYLEVEEVNDPNTVLVQNTILTDLFPDQKNVVHVELGGETKSLLLTRSSERGLLNFNN